MTQIFPNRLPCNPTSSTAAAAWLFSILHWAISALLLGGIGGNTAWADAETRAVTDAEAKDITALDQATRDLTIGDTSRYFIQLSPETSFQHEPPEPIEADDPLWAPPGKTVYRINCGLTEAIATEKGLERGAWQFDRESPGTGHWGAIGGRNAVRPADIPFHSSPYPEVLRIERYDLTGYRLPVPPGQYIVRLHFAEGFEAYIEPGRRVFDILLNGEVVWERFDPYVASGGMYRGSLMDIRGAEPVNGALTLEFRSHVGAPAICGIEVFQVEVDHAPLAAQMMTTPQKRTPVERPEDRRLVRVLWIGNSQTFFWALPDSVAAMVNASQDEFWMQPYYYLHGGWGLGRFLREKSPNALDVIREGRYDYVVLQTDGASSASRKENPQERIDRAMGRLDIYLEAVRESGAKPVLYLTGEPADRLPEAKEQLRDRIEDYQITVVPAGAAWHALRSEHGDSDRGLVLESDGVHLGLHTAYLNTCVHAIPWIGGPPTSLSRFLAGREVPIEPEKARFLESFAWELWSQYDREHGPLTFVEDLAPAQP